MSKQWTEPELSRHLGPVKAPPELWDRVQSSRLSPAPAPSRGAMRGWTWAAAAASVVVVLGTVWSIGRSKPDVSTEDLAVQGLSRAAGEWKYRSGEITEMRSWIKSGTGLDVPLPSALPPSVHLVGASLIEAKTPTAQIAYRVGEMDATLVVAKMETDPNGKHTVLRNGSHHGSSYLTWTMRGQVYTVAGADFRVGCLLCHSTSPRAL